MTHSERIAVIQKVFEQLIEKLDLLIGKVESLIRKKSNGESSRKDPTA